MVSFFRPFFSGMSFFHSKNLHSGSKAFFVSGNLYASRESNQGSHAECGCEAAFVSVVHLLSLEKISLFRHCGFMLKCFPRLNNPRKTTCLDRTIQNYVLLKLGAKHAIFTR